MTTVLVECQERGRYVKSTDPALDGKPWPQDEVENLAGSSKKAQEFRRWLAEGVPSPRNTSSLVLWALRNNFIVKSKRARYYRPGKSLPALLSIWKEER